MSNRTRNTIENLADAIGATMIPEEDEQKEELESLSMAISIENPKKMGNKSISLQGVNFEMPADFSSSIDSSSDLRRLVSIPLKFHVVSAAFFPLDFLSKYASTILTD